MCPVAAWATVTITTQPASQTVPPGTDVTFAVTAIGEGELLYQWRHNGVNLPDATTAILQLTNVQPQSAGKYTVLVADSTDSVRVSEKAILQVVMPAVSGFADLRTNAGLLTNAAGVGVLSNAGATWEPGELSVMRILGGASVWVRWQPPVRGIATLETTGSDFDTILGVYDINKPNKLVVANDDGGGFGCSRVQFNASPDTVYEIVLDGVGGQTGSLVFTWNVEPTDEVLAEIYLQPTDQIAPLGSNVAVRVRYDATNGVAIQWFHNGEPLPGKQKDHVSIEALSAADVGTYVARLYYEDTGREVFTDSAAVQVSSEGVASRNKYVDVLQASTGAQTAGMSVRDGPSGGLARGYSGTQIFSSLGGTTDEDEPPACGVIGGSSYWFVYQALRDGPIEFNTDGSSFDTVMSVFLGAEDGSLNSVACDNNSGADGHDSKVVFSAQAGAIYFVVVDGVGAANGTVVLNYDLTVAPAVLEQPASRAVVRGGNTTFEAIVDGNPLSAQWYFQGAPVAGATSFSLTISNVQVGLGGQYWVVTTNRLGSVASDPAELWLIHTQSVLVRFARTNSGFLLRAACPTSGRYVLQASTNLQNWVTLATNSAPLGIADFLDSAAQDYPSRFYRTRPE